MTTNEKNELEAQSAVAPRANSDRAGAGIATYVVAAVVAVVIAAGELTRRKSLAGHRDGACRERQEEGTNSEGFHVNLLRGSLWGMNRRALLHREAERRLNEAGQLGRVKEPLNRRGLERRTGG